MIKGTIIKGIGGFYYVKSDDGIYSCRARGKFRKDSQTPIVGDLAEIEVTDNVEKQGYVVNILPRKNELFRPLVSNIDLLLITFAVASPAPSLQLIDKLTVTAAQKNIPTAICINKCDLNRDLADEYKEIYTLAGYPVLTVSALRCENVDKLKALLKNKTTALAGNSGVGKSTLINAILPELSVKTGEISDYHNKGMHTTTFSEMFPVENGGYLIDTPGIKGFGTFDMEEEEVGHYFKEIFEQSANCKYGNCTHRHEPGCAVREAVEKHLISESRYNSYLNMLEDKEEGKYRAAY